MKSEKKVFFLVLCILCICSYATGSASNLSLSLSLSFSLSLSVFFCLSLYFLAAVYCIRILSCDWHVISSSGCDIRKSHASSFRHVPKSPATELCYSAMSALSTHLRVLSAVFMFTRMYGSLSCMKFFKLSRNLGTQRTSMQWQLSKVCWVLTLANRQLDMYPEADMLVLSSAWWRNKMWSYWYQTMIATASRRLGSAMPIYIHWEKETYSEVTQTIENIVE